MRMHLAAAAYSLAACFVMSTGLGCSSTEAPRLEQVPETLDAAVPPACAIVSPSEGERSIAGETTVLVASVSGVPLGAIASWHSHRDGALSQSPLEGGLVVVETTDLQPGEHILNFQITTGDDSDVLCHAVQSHVVVARPSVNVEAPIHGSVVPEGSDVEIVANVGASEDPSGLTVTVSSSRDGVLGQPVLVGDRLTQGERRVTPTLHQVRISTELSVGFHRLEVLVTTADGLRAQASVDLSVDGAPSLPVFGIVPEHPHTGDDLSFVISEPSRDPEGEVVSYRSRWVLEGEEALSVEGATVFAEQTARGQRWRLELAAQDAVNVGPTATRFVQIVNSPPELSQVSISPASPTPGDVISCVHGDATDRDGDSVSYTTRWVVAGGVAWEGESVQEPGRFQHGQQVQCAVTPDDGLDKGVERVSAPVTVIEAPQVTGVTIMPEHPVVGDTLTCQYTFTDPDQRPDLSTVRWHLNDLPVGEGALLAPSLDLNWARGDALRCTLIPYNGVMHGEAVDAHALVGNSPPTATHVAWTPVYPTAKGPVALEVETDDGDGDVVTLDFAWWVNGQSIDSDASTLAQGLFVRGDIIAFEVTPHDGFDAGTPVSGTVTVANSLPSAPTVLWEPAEPIAGSPLRCALGNASIDADGDLLSYQVRLEVDGLPYPPPGTGWQGPDSTILAGDTVPGADVRPTQQWRCVLTPQDGLGDGTSAEAVVSVSCDSDGDGSCDSDDPCPSLAYGVLDCDGICADVSRHGDGICDSGTVFFATTVELITTEWGAENSWSILDSAGQIVAEEAGFPDASELTWTLALSPGDYELVLGDSYGDGWHGGSIALKSPCPASWPGLNGETVTASSLSVPFTVASCGLDVVHDGPDPVTVTMQAGPTPLGAGWKLYDEVGELVASSPLYFPSQISELVLPLSGGGYRLVLDDAAPEAWESAELSVHSGCNLGTLVQTEVTDGSLQLEYLFVVLPCGPDFSCDEFALDDGDCLDSDGDMVFDDVDICPFWAADDEDGDGVCGDVDGCPLDYDPEQSDLDEDGVGDLCDPDLWAEGAVRLVGGSGPEEGRVEIFYDGQWGTVCDSVVESAIAGPSHLGYHTANLLCQAAGYALAVSYECCAHYGPGLGPVWLSEVSCSGGEVTIDECEGAQWGEVSCGHDYDLGLRCDHDSDGDGVGDSVDICPQGECLSLPDFTIDAEHLQDTAYLDHVNVTEGDCYIQEGCVDAPGMRKVLRFGTRVANIGNVSYTLEGPPGDYFHYDACHDHYHYEEYAAYDLIDPVSGALAAQGFKSGWCLMDSGTYDSELAVHGCGTYDCGFQGIGMGCYDEYHAELDCQWIDVTDVPDGDYQLRVGVNPYQRVPELTYDNNVALVAVSIEGNVLTVGAPDDHGDDDHGDDDHGDDDHGDDDHGDDDHGHDHD